MNTKDEDESRMRFEKTMAEKRGWFGRDFVRTPAGDYECTHSSTAWQIWKLAKGMYDQGPALEQLTSQNVTTNISLNYWKDRCELAERRLNSEPESRYKIPEGWVVGETESGGVRIQGPEGDPGLVILSPNEPGKMGRILYSLTKAMTQDGLTSEGRVFSKAPSAPCFSLPVDASALTDLILDQHWQTSCEIIPDYVPRKGLPGEPSRVVVRYGGGTAHPKFLRHSCGPKQGFFWDIYGDDLQSIEIAILALSQAPCPL